MPRRIAFVSPPFAGHLNPILQLAEAAASAGYRVSVTTTSAKRATVSARGLACHTLASLDGGRLEAISDTHEPVRGNPRRLLDQFRRSLVLAAAARLELLDQWRPEPPDLVVADSIAISAGLAADALGVPWMTTVATPFAIECQSGTPSYLGGWSSGHGPLYGARDAVGRMFVATVKRAVAFAARREMAALGVSAYRADGSEACYSPDSILGFGLNELEFPRDWPAAFTMIGPLFESPEEVGVPNLPEARPRVLVTLGTHLFWAKRSLADDVRWLAERGPKATFVVSRGAPEIREPTQQVADNVFVVPFVPYAAGLSSFDAVIHHGGAGVTYAAIAAAKPSIVIPHDYDQFDFAARVVAAGAGVRSRRLASPETLAALDEVLSPGRFPELRALSAAAASYRPAETFLSEVGRLTGP